MHANEGYKQPDVPGCTWGVFKTVWIIFLPSKTSFSRENGSKLKTAQNEKNSYFLLENDVLLGRKMIQTALKTPQVHSGTSECL